MKKLVFWLLKIFEVGGVVFIPYWVGRFMLSITHETTHWTIAWLGGLASLAAVWSFFYLFYLLIKDGVFYDIFKEWVGINKKWAFKIVGRS